MLLVWPTEVLRRWTMSKIGGLGVAALRSILAILYWPWPTTNLLIVSVLRLVCRPSDAEARHCSSRVEMT